jgi:hypothetical protein
MSARRLLDATVGSTGSWDDDDDPEGVATMSDQATVSDEALRSHARRVWRGIEQGALRLERNIRSPAGAAAVPIDPEFLPSHIIGLNLLAAADHARTMAAVITDPKLGPSAATVARGVVENLARVHWISVGETGDEVKARALHVLRKDVQSSARTTRFTAKRPDHPSMTHDEYAELIKERIDSLAVPGLNWSVSTAIDNIAREQWRHFEPRIPYSNLSLIAHGHLPGLAMLIRGDHKTMRLPRQEVINQVGVVLAITDKAVHALQRCPLPILPKGCVPEQWETITLELMPAIQTLMAEDRGTPPVQVQRGE